MARKALKSESSARLSHSERTTTSASTRACGKATQRTCQVRRGCAHSWCWNETQRKHSHHLRAESVSYSRWFDLLTCYWATQGRHCGFHRAQFLGKCEYWKQDVRSLAEVPDWLFIPQRLFPSVSLSLPQYFPVDMLSLNTVFRLVNQIPETS